ncbi:hypothetical protein [Virgibacillus dokdonensis]|uniref:Uncharacterized protein n=1 Tax=Virgibacillus dokdonensis TaxID=302167 RepID=A0ABU7VJF5_9BACI
MSNEAKKVDSNSILELLEAASEPLSVSCHHPNVYYAEDEDE